MQMIIATECMFLRWDLEKEKANIVNTTRPTLFVVLFLNGHSLLERDAFPKNK